MRTITTIALDIAKSVFQVHGVDAGGQVVVRRQLKRRSVLAFFQKLSPCLVGIEACASSHHWSRELQALGHTVRLMPPAYVKPYVKRQRASKTMFQMLGVFAEFERGIIRERVNAGLARARAKGTKLGRRPIKPAIEARIRELKAEGMGILKIARALGVGTSVVQRVVLETA